VYPTTQDYKNAVYAPSRRVVGKVTFDITDVTAYSDTITITTNGESGSISNKDQIKNRERVRTSNFVTCETNRTKLDGSFSFADDTTNSGELGFVSNVVCGVDGVFATPPTVTVEFGATHSSIGLTVTFDELNNEYAVDYDLATYDSAGTLIKTVSVVGNTDVSDEAFGQADNYKKIVLTIKKWSVGDRRARVSELEFGLVKVYSDNSLIRMNLVEDLDLTSAKLPSAEFSFEVDNLDRAFNILNPTGFYSYLQQRQKVYVSLGLNLDDIRTEFIPLGSYFLSEWISNEGSITASFKARTALDLMSSYSYENLTAVTKSLTQFAKDIFAVCGITDYVIDTSLDTINTNSLVKNKDCKTIMQMIALAGECNVFVGRDSKIYIKPVKTIGTTVDSVNFDNSYNEPQVTLEKIVKKVDVTYWTDLATSGISSTTATGVDEGETLELKENTLINDSTRALAVANWLLAQKNDRRTKHTTNWRGNPALELSDPVSVENSYGANKTALVTKINLSYEGYLKAQTEARGG
jgi:hypothetical protein